MRLALLLAQRIWIWGYFSAIVGLGVLEFQARAQSNERPSPPSIASDATLRASSAPSADRIWVVGDRGLIMATDNGGRSWIEQESDTTYDLGGVDFDDDKTGWVVGGSVQPYSHRSVGVLLSTHDGGRSWRSSATPELPRLRGIQSFGGGHLMVWGDWSPTLQTGLLESLDGGATWRPRELPASHLQSCAWLDSQHGIAIDRLSRVFYCSADAPAEQLPIGGDPTKPLLAAAINETGWWLVGAAGQVYWSADGRKWFQRSLPGNALDHQLIVLHGLAVREDHVWLLGTPGNVVWYSKNRGVDWEVQSLSTTLPMYCICHAAQDCLIAAGTLANIQGTRNSGQGWWPIHSKGSRVALFNIATTIDHLAWDALAYMANETRHQAAALVIHEQRLHERTDALCDQSSRVIGLANPLGLAMLEVYPGYPIGDLRKGRRKSDIAAYVASANDASHVVRTLVLWIRMARPETIVSDEKVSEDPLLLASADALTIARRLASEATYRCFSSDTGIAEQVWNCKHVVARKAALVNPAHVTLKRRSEISFASTTALKSSGKLLSNVLAPVIPTVADFSETGCDGYQELGSLLFADYNTIYGPASKAGKDHLLVELVHAADTKRPQHEARHANFQSMIVGSQQSTLMSRMLDMKGPDLSNDVRWQASLKSFVRSISPEQHADLLWQLAQGYRQRGYWNRWRVCLETLIAEAPRSGAAELACLQELQLLGSAEVNHFRSRFDLLPSSFEGATNATFQTAFMSSPFAQDNKLANHTTTLSKSSISPVDEFQRIRASVAVRFPTLQWDPRFLVIDAAFQRRFSIEPASHPSINTSPAKNCMPIQRLASCIGLVGWGAIGLQEMQTTQKKIMGDRKSGSALVGFDACPYPIQKTELRPKLDGRFDDPLWPSIVAMPLHGVLVEDADSACDVRMAYDDDFLYIAVTNQRGAVNRQSPDQTLPEQLTFRFDTDRDYLTWFELQVDEEGQVIERCTDMEGWQPEWYFKTESEEKQWRLEAAIPIEQLRIGSLASNEIWAMAIQRAIPSRGVQTNRAVYADRLLLTSPTLVRFSDPIVPSER